MCNTFLLLNQRDILSNQAISETTLCLSILPSRESSSFSRIECRLEVYTLSATRIEGTVAAQVSTKPIEFKAFLTTDCGTPGCPSTLGLQWFITPFPATPMDDLEAVNETLIQEPKTLKLQFFELWPNLFQFEHILASIYTPKLHTLKVVDNVLDMMTNNPRAFSI